MRLHLFLSLLAPIFVNAAVITLSWTLTWVDNYSFEAPPSINPTWYNPPPRRVIGVNYQWPIPTTTVNVGDVIRIYLYNMLDSNTAVTLHAHGFRQMNNNFMDGPEDITQCGIKYFGQFMYQWTADEAGTFWVHSHHVGQYPYGLRAPFIVKDPDEPNPNRYNYDPKQDVTISVSDWYTYPMAAVEETYRVGSCTAGLEVPPDGVLMNDKLNPIINLPALSSTTNDGRIRLRFINMSAFSTMIIFLTDVNGQPVRFRVQEVDSVRMNRDYMPFAKAIELNAGQRVSIIVDPVDTSWANFNIYSTIDPEHYSGNACAENNGYLDKTYAFSSVGRVKFDGLTTPAPLYQFSAPSPVSTYTDTQRLWVAKTKVPPVVGREISEIANLPSWANKFVDDANVVSDNWYKKLPPSDSIAAPAYQAGVTPYFYLDLTANGTSQNEHASLNNENFIKPVDGPILLKRLQKQPTCSDPSKVPTLSAMRDYYGSSILNNALGGTLAQRLFWGAGTTIYEIQPGSTIFLFIASHIGSHTFHLHGHNFQVLYHGSEARPTTYATKDEMITARDRVIDQFKAGTLPMPENPMRRDTLFITQKTFSIVSFKADNPGAWFFHCHNDFHAMSGMAGVFVTNSEIATDTNVPSWWGSSIYNQCGFASNSAYPAEFDDWKRQCLP